MKKYDTNINYIGNSEWQYKFTSIIYNKCKGINYTAYIHDNLYNILWAEKYLIALIVSKVLFDIIFLVMGIIRSLRNLEVQGVFFAIILYLVLLLSTPYFFYTAKLKYKL